MNKKKPLYNHFNHTILHAQKFSKKHLDVIEKIIKRGVFFNGDQTKKLEKNLATYLGVNYITSVASGHDALLFALNALDLQPYHEIIVPVNSTPSAFPVALTKAKPVFIDVDHNGLIDVNQLEKKITKNTKAVVVVHLYGNVSNIEKIQSILHKKNIAFIEDCAQSFGSEYKGKKVGSFGDFACFSFYPTKNLSTLGDGGAIATKHKKYFKHILQMKSYGESKRYYSTFIAGHSRIPEIQAGIINIHFERFIHDIFSRRHVKKWYDEIIKKKSLQTKLQSFHSDPASLPVPHLYVVKANKRDALRKYFSKTGIETHIHYPYPLHLLPAFASLNHKKGDFPIAEYLSHQIVSLPFHPYLKKKDIEKIISEVYDFYHI